MTVKVIHPTFLTIGLSIFIIKKKKRIKGNKATIVTPKAPVGKPIKTINSGEVKYLTAIIETTIVISHATKPFSPSVLMARINKLLKRDTKVHEEVVFGVIRMDLAAREVFIADEKVALTPKEYELLKYFIDNKGIALSRDKILNAVWNYDYFGDLRTVDTHIKQLRAKLGNYAFYVSTVRSIGYRLDLENEIIH